MIISDSAEIIKKAVEVGKWIKNARSVFLILGAGISVGSGIPDFRSSNGVYNKFKNSYGNLFISGKEFFDGGLLYSRRNCERTKMAYFIYISELKKLVDSANIGKIHELIIKLIEEKRLMRVYTQNIDGLEKKAIQKLINKWSKPEKKIENDEQTLKKKFLIKSPQRILRSYLKPIPKPIHEKKINVKDNLIVELHGNLRELLCTKCGNEIDFSPVLEIYRKGGFVECEECKKNREKRIKEGKRPLGIGLMTPKILLYNDFNVEGFTSGLRMNNLIEKNTNLIANDILAIKKASSNSKLVFLIIGTSFKVYGLQDLVKRMKKALGKKLNNLKNSKFIYINKDPLLQKQWKSFFDLQLVGDCDLIAKVIENGIK